MTVSNEQLLGFLFVGAFQLVVDVIQLLLVTFFQSLFIRLKLHGHQFHLLLRLLQVLLTPPHVIRLRAATNSKKSWRRQRWQQSPDSCYAVILLFVWLLPTFINGLCLHNLWMQMCYDDKIIIEYKWMTSRMTPRAPVLARPVQSTW